MLVGTPFRIAETHGILSRLENHARTSSDRYDWTSLYASAQRELPYEGYFPAVADQLIVMHLDGPVTIDRTHGSGKARCTVPAGGIHLVPGGMDFGLRLGGALSTLHVYVRRAIIEEVAAEMVDGDPAAVEIPPQFLGPEPALTHLLAAVKLALTDDDFGNGLYVDYLTRALASQLLRSYSGRRTRAVSALGPPGMVGPVISNAIEYMRAHLEQSLSLERIARAVNRSPSQFSRQFRNALGVPPHQYLLALRLEKAQRMLATTRTSIAEIALECGFSHQEHLTRIFRRQCDTTPAVFRKSKTS